MTDRVVVDASALAALTFREQHGDQIGVRLRGAEVFAPALLKFEMANVACKKARRAPEEAASIIGNLNAIFDGYADIAWHDVDVADVTLVAQALGVSAYDASYLWLAGYLGADLVTLDERLARLSAAMAT